jgi:pimeloyl-ACP methyl ester carboxylesterase
MKYIGAGAIRVASHDRFFTAAGYRRRVLAPAGHDLPQEAPDECAEAVLSLAIL